jgi:hypothetical protein
LELAHFLEALEPDTDRMLTTTRDFSTLSVHLLETLAYSDGLAALPGGQRSVREDIFHAVDRWIQKAGGAGELDLLTLYRLGAIKERTTGRFVDVCALYESFVIAVAGVKWPSATQMAALDPVRRAFVLHCVARWVVHKIKQARQAEDNPNAMRDAQQRAHEYGIEETSLVDLPRRSFETQFATQHPKKAIEQLPSTAELETHVFRLTYYREKKRLHIERRDRGEFARIDLAMSECIGDGEFVWDAHVCRSHDWGVEVYLQPGDRCAVSFVAGGNHVL